MKVLVVGCGNMGKSHALAYEGISEYEICGLVSRGKSKEVLNSELKGDYPLYNDYFQALADSKPDVVCISTYPDTHKDYSLAAFVAGAHVFCEKPIALTLEETEEIIKASKKFDKKLIVGYILRHHPSWQKFVEISHTMGSPLVMRMNLNQQSKGDTWNTHKHLMDSMLPIVDCGVHYVDVMCQMVQKKPVAVSAIAAKLSNETTKENYGQLQVRFEDGSVGWYEAGWGPMMSEVAFFVKDVIGPKGCVSIVADNASSESQSDNVNAHTKTESLKVHYADLDENNQFKKEDKIINLEDEPDHNELCRREQEYLLNVIKKDIDVSQHLEDARNSLNIVLAAEQSFKEGKTIDLK